MRIGAQSRFTWADEHIDPDLVPDRLGAFGSKLREATGSQIEFGGSSSGRYSARFSVNATSLEDAVGRALQLFRVAAEGAGLPPWPVVQIEGQTD